MDKLKEQLAPVLKHMFWILCGAILIVSIVSWYQATSHMKSEQERLTGDINGKVSGVTSIPAVHPNENTLKGMDEQNQRYAEEVAKAWAMLVAQQEKVLVWNSTVFDAEFIRAVAPLRPPELKVRGTLSDEISKDDRTLARNKFEGVLPDLAKTIGAKWNAKAQAAGGMGGMGGGMGAGMSPGMGASGGAMPGLGGAFGGAAPGADGTEGPFEGAGQTQEVDDSLVIWNPGNQSELLNNHFSFVADATAIPTTLQILYAQEDVWILQNIMNIIKATNEANGPISHRHEAAIKFIDSVHIGRTALAVAGKVSSSTSGASGGGGAGGPGMMPGMSSEGMMGGAMAGGGMAGGGMGGGGAGPGGADEGVAAAEPGAGADASGGATPGMAGSGTAVPGMSGQGGSGSDPADNRYVDLNYKPLAAERLKKAMRGEPQDPKDLMLAVAKRVPVRLHFKMDQRRLPVLLTECGNSRLPVEIKQVRVNRQSGGGFGGGMSGMMGGGGGMMPGMAGGMGGMMGGMMGGAAGGDEGAGGAFPGAGGAFGGGAGVNPSRSKVADASIDPNEISVEVYGIVYLYNPVNRAVLGLPATSEGTPAVTPPITPASTSPPTVPVTPASNTGASTTAPTTATPGVN